MRPDVVIVGAGPSGSAAAIRLSREGRRVTLVDKATFPRDKCCGDGLTTGALRDLEQLGFRPTTLASFTSIDGLSVRSPSGRVVRLPFRDDGGIFGAVVRRSDLDNGLLDLARSSGVEVETGCKIHSIEASTDSSYLSITSDSGKIFEAPFVLAADGAHSSVRHSLARQNLVSADDAHKDSSGAEFFAYRTYAKHVSPMAAEELWVDFSPALLPGYAWSFPLAGNTANIGICFLRHPHDKGASLSAKWQQAITDSFLVSLLGKDAVIDEPVRAWPIPFRVATATCSSLGGRLLFIGDAVRSADPMSGEGVGQALTTAQHAVESLVADSDSPSLVAARYEEQLLSGLAREHRMATFFSHVLANPLLARGIVCLCGLNGWTARNAARWLYEDYPRTDVLQISRWPSIRQHAEGPFSQIA